MVFLSVEPMHLPLPVGKVWAIIDGFQEMIPFDGGTSLQIRNGPGYPQDSVIATGAEPDLVIDAFQIGMLLRAQGTETLDLLWRQV